MLVLVGHTLAADATGLLALRGGDAAVVLQPDVGATAGQMRHHAGCRGLPVEGHVADGDRAPRLGALASKRFLEFPLVMQYNKRDVPDVLPLEILEKYLNAMKAPAYESIASRGVGVFDTLRTVSKLVISKL